MMAYGKPNQQETATEKKKNRMCRMHSNLVTEVNRLAFRDIKCFFHDPQNQIK